MLVRFFLAFVSSVRRSAFLFAFMGALLFSKVGVAEDCLSLFTKTHSLVPSSVSLFNEIREDFKLAHEQDGAIQDYEVKYLSRLPVDHPILQSIQAIDAQGGLGHTLAAKLLSNWMVSLGFQKNQSEIFYETWIRSPLAMKLQMVESLDEAISKFIDQNQISNLSVKKVGANAKSYLEQLSHQSEIQTWQDLNSNLNLKEDRVLALLGSVLHFLSAEVDLAVIAKPNFRASGQEVSDSRALMKVGEKMIDRSSLLDRLKRTPRTLRVRRSLVDYFVLKRDLNEKLYLVRLGQLIANEKDRLTMDELTYILTELDGWHFNPLLWNAQKVNDSFLYTSARDIIEGPLVRKENGQVTGTTITSMVFVPFGFIRYMIHAGIHRKAHFSNEEFWIVQDSQVSQGKGFLRGSHSSKNGAPQLLQSTDFILYLISKLGEPPSQQDVKFLEKFITNRREREELRYRLHHYFPDYVESPFN